LSMSWNKRLIRYANVVKTFENWPVYFQYRKERKGSNPIQKLTDPIVFKCRHHRILIAVPKSKMDNLFEEIFALRIYWPNFWSWANREKLTVLDIGSNIGLFSYFVFSQFPNSKIIAVEPIEENLRWMESLHQMNPTTQFFVKKGVIYSERNEVDLFLAAEGPFPVLSSVLSTFSQNISKKIRIPSYLLEDLFNEYQIEKCDLCKLDCEGAEYEILFHCPSNIYDRINRIVLEAHHIPHPQYSPLLLHNFLKDRGYSVYSEPMTEQTTMIYAWK